MTPPKSELHTIDVPVDQVTDRRLDPIRAYAESIGSTVEDVINDYKEMALHNLLGDRQRLSEGAAESQTAERPRYVRGGVR